MSFKHLLTKIKNFILLQKLKHGNFNTYYALIATISTGTYIYYLGKQKKLSQEVYPSITLAVDHIASAYIPISMREYLFKAYAKRYGVNVQEVQKDLKEYQNLGQFFTRKIKSRSQTQQQLKNLNTISSPCDGQILNISKVQKDSNLIVKNIEYSLSKLLFQINDNQNINQLKMQQNNELYQIIIYLKPGDYHRFHAPINLSLLRIKSISGKFRPVNIESLLKSGGCIYQQNSRKIIHGAYTVKKMIQRQIQTKKQGKKTKMVQIKKQNRYLGLVFVGALNVSKIIINQKKNYMKGQQIGFFNLGSTIVMLLESKANTKWQKKPGDKIKYGERLCSID